MVGYFARSGERLKLLVDVCCVSLFSRSDSADDDKQSLFGDSVDHSERREFVLPVEIQRGPQGKTVALEIHRKFFRQNFLELISYASIQGSYVPEGIAGERDGILGLGSAQGSPKTSSIV